MEIQAVIKKSRPQPREPSTLWRCDICSKPGGLYRFRCTVCPDYDNCFQCYATRYHSHHMKMVNENTINTTKKAITIFTCDGCQRANADIRYRCSDSCDFDFCSNCYLQKDHKHQMKYVGGSTKWFCDGCNAGFTADARAYRFRCVDPRCDFDYCKDCINTNTHAHPLKQLYGFHSFYCNGCGEWNKSFRFRCTSCEDFDFCDDCYLTKTHPTSHSFRMINANMSYTCDNCDGYSLPNRHRCTVCHDYDLCGNCYSADKHPQHQMKKFAFDTLLSPYSPPSPPIKKDSKSNNPTTTPVENIDTMEEGEDTTCVVCMENPRNSVIIHGESGHQICCLNCARELNVKKKGCPICRAPIDNVVKLFK